MARKAQRAITPEFYDRCRHYAARRGYGVEIYEDFPSWAYARKAEGSSATIGQLFIDYLRITLGTKSSPNRHTRQALREASGNSSLLADIPLDQRDDSSNADKCQELFGQLSGRDRAFVGLHFWYGLSREEIGRLYGISTVRVGQIFRAVFDRIAAAEAAQNSEEEA